MFPEGRILDFLLVGVIALIVVGPKDLPVLMRRVGEFVGKMRAMAAEFRASFDEMARQSELEELRKEVEAMRAGQPVRAAAEGVLGLGPDAPARQVFDEINAGLESGAAQLHPPMGYQYPSSFQAAPEVAPDANPEAAPDPDGLLAAETDPPAAASEETPAPAKAAP